MKTPEHMHESPEAVVSPSVADTVLTHRRVVAALGSGILLALCFPPYNVPWVMPAGIALLAWALDNLPAGKSFWLGLLCGIPYFGGTLFWLADLFPLRAPSLILLCALFPALFAACYSLVRRHGPPLPISLAMAICWTAVEFFRSELFPLAFGWMGLGYGLVGLPLVARLASWIGSYGVTFIAVVIGVRLLYAPTFVPWKRTFVVAVGLLWLVLSLMPLPRPPAPANPVNVRLVQSDSGDLRQFIDLSIAEGGRRADVIVWPEYSVLVDYEGRGRNWQRIAELARGTDAYVVFGTIERLQRSERFWNVAYVISPEGTLAGRHVKNHPVYFMNDGLPGAAAQAVDSDVGAMGVAICFDMSFPGVARRLANGGAEFFVVPNMDPIQWSAAQRDQHKQMFQMRAVECGRWVARADAGGGTAFFAPTGHIVDRVAVAGPTALDGQVGRSHRTTLYVAGGWTLVWLNLAAAVVLVSVSLVRAARDRDGRDNSSDAMPCKG